MNKILLTAIAVFLFPSITYAHEMSGGGGFISGFSHPVLGFDHLLAMLSVGILSAQMGGRAIWSVPAAFVSVMLVGGILGISGIPLFSVEFGIAASVFVLGISITTEKKLSPLIAMAFVAFFAMFHGYAHGLEMPSLAKPAYYAIGFILGTSVIHIAGVFIGMMAKKVKTGKEGLKYVGAGIAGIGFYLMVM